MDSRRIHIEKHTDYPWPFVAVLQRQDDDGEWVEVDAEGGNTPDQAVETLRDECTLAWDVEVA